MVTSTDILELLDPYLVRIPKEMISDDLPLVQQGLDSLDMATLLFEVEGKFDVLIPTNVVGHLRSLRDISEFLNAARARGAAEAK